MMKIYEKFNMKISGRLKNFLHLGDKKKTLEDVAEDNSPLVIDTESPIRLGMKVLGIGFGGLLLWAALAPLDEGVPSAGSVSIDTKRKVIQHLTGGIVKEVHVKEGQSVKEGDVLLSIDNTMAKARYEEIRQRYIGDRALENRLQAEQAGQKGIAFHDDLLKMKDDPLVQQHMRNQEMLLSSRRGSLNAELQGIEESIQGQQAQIEGLNQIIESRHSQLNLLNEQLTNIRGLVEEGYAPKSQQRDLELRIAQVKGDVADAQSSFYRAKRAVLELRQRSIQRKEEYRKDVDTQMSQVKLEVDANADKLHALSDEFDRTEVKSPVTGQVVGLQFQSIGAVIQPGQKIMDIVPNNEGLMLEVKVAPHLIDRIQIGQEADVRFSNFANSPQLAVEGVVNSVSKDLLTEPGVNPAQPGASYYLARVSLTANGVKKLGNRQLQPGMPVQVVIKTGERSLLTYLLHPFMKRMAASLKEE
jgi:protease secretion system membrane fusion protein